MEFSDRSFSLILRHFRVFSTYFISQICTQVLDSGCWNLSAGLWTLDSSHWNWLPTGSEQNQNSVSDSAWLNYAELSEWKSLTISWSRLFCRLWRFWPGYFWKFYINVKSDVLKLFIVHYKQLSRTVQKQPFTAIHFGKFLRKMRVLESFF